MPVTAFVDLLGGPAAALLVVALFVVDVGCIATVVWHGRLSRMAKGDKRGKDHSTTKPKPGGKTDGRLKANGGGAGGRKRGPKPK